MISTSALFSKCVFAISLNNVKDSRVKKELVQEITSNGGEISFGVSKTTTHLITTEKDVADLTFVVRSALKNGCWIVMPAFVFDSTRANRRDKEWNHMYLGNKPALHYAEDEDAWINKCFSKALSNVNKLAAGANSVESNLHSALHRIKSLSIQLTSQFSDSSNQLNKSVPDIVETMFQTIPDPSTILAKMVIPPASKTKKSYTSPFKSSFKNPLLKEGQLTFMERATLKQKEREEKAKKLEQEKAEKLLVRQQKEEERIKREQERKVFEEAERKRIQEIKEREEEERRLLKEQYERESRERFEQSIAGIISYKIETEEEIAQREEREQFEKQAAERDRKIQLKKQRKAAKKIKKQEFIAAKQQIRSERKQVRVGEETKKQEEKQAIAIEKQRRRDEYQARQERKVEKMMNNISVVIAEPKPTDDDRKMFVGGISFKDIEKLPNMKSIRNQRLAKYWELFAKFGEIEKKKDFILDKKHCFIVYSSQEEMQKALSALGKYEDRQVLCREMRATIMEEKGVTKEEAKKLAPSPHFYVRAVKSEDDKNPPLKVKKDL